jgi:hypothetical protein
LFLSMSNHSIDCVFDFHNFVYFYSVVYFCSDVFFDKTRSSFCNSVCGPAYPSRGFYYIIVWPCTVGIPFYFTPILIDHHLLKLPHLAEPLLI